MYAKRTDSNQTAIVSGLRKAGYSVAVTSHAGRGFPDIVVGWQGKNFLFEIKDPEQPASKQKLTTMEKMLFLSWRGQIDIITSVEDAIQKIKERCAKDLGLHDFNGGCKLR